MCYFIFAIFIVLTIIKLFLLIILSVVKNKSFFIFHFAFLYQIIAKSSVNKKSALFMISSNFFFKLFGIYICQIINQVCKKSEFSKK